MDTTDSREEFDGSGAKQTCSSSRARKVTSGSRWLPPPFPSILNTKRFCLTKEDFNEVYGLSLTGVDPRALPEEALSENDWLSVYYSPRGKGKVKLRSVRQDLYQELMQLHQKVYQENPFNCEISVMFARGFALEHCKRAIEAPNKSAFQVAWAVVAEGSIELCRKTGKLEGKMKRFLSSTMPSTSETSQQPTSVPTSSKPPVVQKIDTGIVEGNLASLQKKVNEEDLVLQQLEKELLVYEASENAKESLCSGIGAKLLQKLEHAEQQLSSGKSPDGQPLEEIARRVLEAQIESYQETLSQLGYQKTRPAHVEDLQKKINAQKELLQQLKKNVHFLERLINRVQKEGTTVSLPLPATRCVGDTKQVVVCLPCTACGLSMEDAISTITILFSCQHAYHGLCFISVCHESAHCVAEGCTSLIPEDVRCKLTSESKQVGKQSSAAVPLHNVHIPVF